MKKLPVLIAVALLALFVGRADAQTAPCDLPTATSGTFVVNTPMTFAVCSNSTDQNGAPTVITGWALYDGATRTTPTMVADTVVSATGFRQYTLASTSPATAGVHTYTMAELNSIGEGTRSAPFVLTVSLAPTAPSAPIKLIIR
jgi:hypothetical protein